ncbi:protease modulator HflC [Candidatus Synchoanobacter obligatus]|uniref:Protein HflC n=1 Tax=Candidatus Synchoanobacter obligatus TaxID=2919597 RepID=A0ABT1L973_9GAMM|nr:protease modulator HflC [Candidatus Synchoanobacter obligatus]MCP8352633.1 protease modulator HflC [Candidatus Synchoanobacter obligatus]
MASSNSNNQVFVLMIAAVAILALSQSLFVVMPMQAGMVVHLGDLNTNDEGQVKVYGPGLHVKLPVIDRLVLIDKRLQSFDVPTARVLTQDQKSMNVDYYSKWRVVDFALFYKRTGANYAQAQDILLRKISDALRAEFGQRNLSEIISGDERNLIIARMQQKASESAANIGVKVQDVRLKRVDYPQEVTLSVYERMRSSRNRDAKRYRSEGMAESERIKAEADKEAAIIISRSRKEAAEKIAEGHSEAAKIFNNAYSRAPEFYEFFIKMQGYEKSIKDGEVMLLSPGNDRFYSILADR